MFGAVPPLLHISQWCGVKA